MVSSSGSGHRHDDTHSNTIEPGKDHYVRYGGKLLAILLASQYPTEFELEQARHEYERGVDGVVAISSRRCRESGTSGEEGVDP